MVRRYVYCVAVLFVAVAFLSIPTSACAQQAKVRTLSEQELVDMMMGSSIQASRGNNTASMVDRLKKLLAGGKTLTMISVDDLPDDWTTVSVAGVGGGGAWEYVTERVKQQNLPTVSNSSLLAVETLSKYLGKKFNATIRIEAASATLTALVLAADLGVPVVDACLSGRARPEVQQQIPTSVGILTAPAALATRFGDTMIIERVVDDYRAEDLSRAVAVGSGGGVSMAMNAMSGRDVKRAVIPGALSQAILFGRTVREAVAQGKDPIAALVKASNGYKLFQGTVTKCVTKGDRGFTWSDVTLNGIGPYAGHTYRVYVKNENIVTWLDDVPDAMSPDFISDLDPKTGDAHFAGPLGAYKEGAEVVMVGFPSSPLWRTPNALKLFGPRHFGFDFDYVPLEQLQKQRK
jgi:DUF917 family protein